MAPVLPIGNAAVAGFSGAIVVGSPPPSEARRIDKTYINLDGPALRVIDLSRMGGPAQGQFVAAPKPFTVTAGQIGQVFSLALDDASPPNIYAAATSAYGLPIVVPDADGDGVPDRSHRGAPNAAFMPGLFGPVPLDGGPGSIWKINGSTGAVSLFANVTLSGVANSGPALGGLAFDPVSHQLFVADRDTGMIHRFTLDGVERGQFDHGTQALTAAGLPPIAFDPRKRLNIESPAFDSGNPATWAYAPPARRVFGLAVNRGRLYYAVAAGLRIWSVSLLPDGSFGPDARVEVVVPRSAPASAEISEILFDDTVDMLVAERGAPTGAYDYKALAEAGENRVLRFRPKGPDDPPSPYLWFPMPKEYAIGFPPDHRNDNGGIAIGYGYDAAGNINRAVCGGMLWSTGEQLRNARDRAIIRRLQPGGPLIVDGLQGNSTRLLRPLNEPPFETYFIDYDDRFEDPQTRGHLGDVVIWRVCGQAMLPAPVVCPVGLFNVDGFCQFGLACPSGTEFSNGCCVYRGCPASYVRIRGQCVPPPMNCDSDKTYSEGRCEAPKCPAGLVIAERKIANVSDRPQKSTDCGPGEVFTNDQCQPAGGRPKMCGNYCKCPEGSRLSEDGTCKPSNGCGVHMVPARGGGGECVCEDGYQWITDTPSRCVPKSQCDLSPGGITTGCCEQGASWNKVTSTCEPPQAGKPKLKIEKTLYGTCYYAAGEGIFCGFLITVTNEGNVPASDVVITETVTPPGVINNWFASSVTGWTCGAATAAGGSSVCRLSESIAPGGSSYLGVIVRITNPNAPYAENCVTLNGSTQANPAAQNLSGIAVGTSALPAPGISTPTEARSCQRSPFPKDIVIPIPPPSSGSPPTTKPSCTPEAIAAGRCGGTLTCPEGARVINGQCFVIDPGCRGSDCPPVTSGCSDGKPRNSDGNCPPPGGSQTTCQFPKTPIAGQCVCRSRTAVGDDCHEPTSEKKCQTGTHLVDGECVRGLAKKKKKKSTPKSSDDPPKQTAPNIELNIGIGIGGGGRGGGPRHNTPPPLNRGGSKG